MALENPRRVERIRRLLGALYREEVRAGVYVVFRRRAAAQPLCGMLGTFLRVEERVIGLLVQHLADLGVGRPGRTGAMRRMLRALGRAIGGVVALGGDGAILRRVQSEEWRGAARYGAEADWGGWSVAERETFDGHRCDQLYQSHWAGEVARDLGAATQAGRRA